MGGRVGGGGRGSEGGQEEAGGKAKIAEKGVELAGLPALFL